MRLLGHSLEAVVLAFFALRWAAMAWTALARDRGPDLRTRAERRRGIPAVW